MTSLLGVEFIIVGGSYAGLSAAMALGRARCRVVVLDAGQPRNRPTPHAHNLLLHDGDAPAELAAHARQQVAAYPTVQLLPARATGAEKLADGTFRVTTAAHGAFAAPTLLLATGLRDELPPFPALPSAGARPSFTAPTATATRWPTSPRACG